MEHSTISTSNATASACFGTSSWGMFRPVAGALLRPGAVRGNSRAYLSSVDVGSVGISWGSVAGASAVVSGLTFSTGFCSRRNSALSGSGASSVLFVTSRILQRDPPSANDVCLPDLRDERTGISSG